VNGASTNNAIPIRNASDRDATVSLDLDHSAMAMVLRALPDGRGTAGLYAPGLRLRGRRIRSYLSRRMKLTCNGTKVIGRLLNIELADADTGIPLPIRMDERGSYLHRHRGNQAFMTALSNFENVTRVSGKPIREVWLATLTDHLALTSA